jgi:hypothetical protein
MQADVGPPFVTWICVVSYHGGWPNRLEDWVCEAGIFLRSSHVIDMIRWIWSWCFFCLQFHRHFFRIWILSKCALRFLRMWNSFHLGLHNLYCNGLLFFFFWQHCNGLLGFRESREAFPLPFCSWLCSSLLQVGTFCSWLCFHFSRLGLRGLLEVVSMMGISFDFFFWLRSCCKDLGAVWLHHVNVNANGNRKHC